MDPLVEAAEKIIHEQEKIIGPIAIEQAKKVHGLEITDKEKVNFKGDGKQVLSALVDQYEHLFGKASIEVCKHALRDLLPKLSKEQLPSTLLN